MTPALRALKGPLPGALLGALLLSVATGCNGLNRVTPGFDGFPEDQEPKPYTVQAWHNVSIAHSLTIYIENPRGERWRLGRLAPSETSTFELPDGTIAGDHHLVAVTPAGRWRRSPPFSSLLGGGVEWDIDRNRISVTPGGEARAKVPYPRHRLPSPAFLPTVLWMFRHQPRWREARR